MSNDYDYHKRQIENVYRSTIFFDDFLSKHIDLSNTSVLDFACGAGGNDLYFARKYPNSKWFGFDYDPHALEISKKEVENVNNLKLFCSNWFDLDYKTIKPVDGCFSLQTVLMLNDWRKAIDAMIKLNPKWIAFSSLFYDGNIEYNIELTDYERIDPIKGTKPWTFNYNIHSISLFKDYLSKAGYKTFAYSPFEIDIDIPKPDYKDIGTYTVKTIDGHRLQISAAMLMPWYFVYASL